MSGCLRRTGCIARHLPNAARQSRRAGWTRAKGLVPDLERWSQSQASLSDLPGPSPPMGEREFSSKCPGSWLVAFQRRRKISDERQPVKASSNNCQPRRTVRGRLEAKKWPASRWSSRASRGAQSRQWRTGPVRKRGRSASGLRSSFPWRTAWARALDRVPSSRSTARPP